jgi:uncharacterized protein HemX
MFRRTDSLAPSATFASSKTLKQPPVRGLTSSTAMTGTIIGVILGAIAIAIGVAVWIVFGRREAEASQSEPAAEECEAAVESQSMFSLEDQFGSCDGGTNFDDQDIFDQGFETNVFENAVDEALPAF